MNCAFESTLVGTQRLGRNDLRLRIRRATTVALGAWLLVLALPEDSSASLISINSLLTNPSFEGGIVGSCPTGWTCTNLGVATPTAGQYPANPSNGLTSGVVPDGSKAAYSPITGSNGNLSQVITGQQFTAGNSYEFKFWLGNPLGGLFTPRVDVFFTTTSGSGIITNTLCDTSGRNATLTSNGLSATENDTPCQFSITDWNSGAWQPADGDWRLYTMTFTTNVNVPGNMGVLFNLFPAQAAENGTLVHMDFPAAQSVTLLATPEPATLALFGTGLFVAAFRLSRRKT